MDNLMIIPLKYHSDVLAELIDVGVIYDGKTACEDISFKIMRGDKIALKGKNGCGKSSALKLICGEKLKYKGTLRMGSNLKISYVSQDTSYLMGSLKEYIREMKIDESLFKAILRKLDFSRNQFEVNLQDLSGGQKKKILFAESLCKKAHLYVWDEPLNFIDVISRIQIENLLINTDITVLFVEHDIKFCNNVATKTINYPL